LTDIFNNTYLKKVGNIPEYIKNVLYAAAETNPYFKYIDAYHNIIDSFYIMDNPNIFPYTEKMAASVLAERKEAIEPDFVSYMSLINHILDTIRYKMVFLNTPVKVEGEWKWVVLAPDTKWIHPNSILKINQKNTNSVSIVDNMTTPTRVLLNPSTSTGNLGYLKENSTRFLFSFPGDIMVESAGDAYPVFSEEEKYRGIIPKNIQMNEAENFYALTKKINLETGKKTEVDNDLYDYMQQIAKKKFYEEKSNNTAVSFTYVDNEKIFPLFPYIMTSSLGEYSMSISEVSFAIDSEGQLNTSTLSDSHVLMENLPDRMEWDPEEYKEKAEEFYKKFEFELMTEKEYWESIGVKKITYSTSKKINAEEIYFGDVKELTGNSLFLEERLKAVEEVIDDFR